jgi:hypothetical protein
VACRRGRPALWSAAAGPQQEGRRDRLRNGQPPRPQPLDLTAPWIPRSLLLRRAMSVQPKACRAAVPAARCPPVWSMLRTDQLGHSSPSSTRPGLQFIWRAMVRPRQPGDLALPYSHRSRFRSVSTGRIQGPGECEGLCQPSSLLARAYSPRSLLSRSGVNSTHFINTRPPRRALVRLELLVNDER